MSYAKVISKALQRRCLSKKEILEILKNKYPDRSYEALIKARKRALDSLIRLELVEGGDEKYCWYVYPNIFNSRGDYISKLEHSRQLIPGLLGLIGVSNQEYIHPIDLEIKIECAKEHLQHTEYKHVDKILEDIRNTSKKRKKLKEELETLIIEDMKDMFSGLIYEYKGKIPDTFISTHIPSLVCNHLIYGNSGVNLDISIRDNEIYINQGSISIAKGNINKDNLKKFLKKQAKDTHNKNIAVKIEELVIKENEDKYKLEQEVRFIIQLIRGGTPLHGICKSCPKFHILSRARAHHRIRI